MAPLGRTSISVLLLALAIVMFVPVFSDASAGFVYGDWAYGPYVAVVLKYLPVVLITTAVLILTKPLDRGGV